MTIAISDRVRAGVVRETTPNTIPAAPSFTLFPFTSYDLGADPETKVSEMIVGDAQDTDLLIVGKDVSGPIGAEIVVDAMDLLVEAVMRSTVVRTAERLNGIGATAQITAVSATAFTTLTGTAWAPGMLVRATGFTSPGNNKVFTAGAASTATNLVQVGGTVEASPPTGARLKQIGFVSAAAADVKATSTGLSSVTTDFTTMRLTVGQWVLVPGLGVTLGLAAGSRFALCPGGYCRISAITSTALTFDQKPAGWAADTATGVTLKVYTSDVVSNGATQWFHTFERAFLDIGLYEYYTGCVIDQMQVDLTQKDLAKWTFNVLGSNQVPPAGARTAGALADTAASTSPVINTSSSIAMVFENGAAISGAGAPGPNYLMSIKFGVNNHSRPLPALATLVAVGINFGTFDVTGTANAYFGDATLLNKLYASTETSFAVALQDNAAAPNAIVFDLPRVKFAKGKVSTGGKNNDLMTPLDFKALKHPTLGYTLAISQFEGIGL